MALLKAKRAARILTVPTSPGWEAAIVVTPFFSRTVVFAPVLIVIVWPTSSLPWRFEWLTSIVIDPGVLVAESYAV